MQIWGGFGQNKNDYFSMSYKNSPKNPKNFQIFVYFVFFKFFCSAVARQAKLVLTDKILRIFQFPVGRMSYPYI